MDSPALERLTLPMKSRSYAITVTVLASVIWGTSFPVIKVGLTYVDSYVFALFRLVIASIAVLAVAIPAKKFQPSLFRNKVIWFLGISNAIGFILQYVGMNYTTASKTVLLVDSDVVIVALLSWLTFKERFSKGTKIAVVLGFLGAALLTTGGNLSELTGGELLGDLLVFFAGVVWAFFMIWNKSLVSRGVDPIAMTASVMPTTALFLLPTAIIFGSTDVLGLAAVGWGAIIFTGVFCSATAYFLWTVGLKGLTVTISAIVLLLEVLFALLLSFVLLGESFSLVSGIGAAMILISIVLASK
jgi:drug/metabolite transporter (DMT)-like permease